MHHAFDVQVYYEDTDFSGVVYHANYLRFFERAREHILGPQALVRMWREEQLGFVVYKASMGFKEGAVFGDILEIRSDVKLESDIRVAFHQRAHRKSDGKLLVDGMVEMVCLDANKHPVSLRGMLASITT
ncbi:MAG TPA: YbgC/FadM family acyl-CoA thioesterase [Myxococcota bacterium]